MPNASPTAASSGTDLNGMAAKIAADAESGSAKLEVEASLARERLEHQSLEGDKARFTDGTA